MTPKLYRHKGKDFSLPNCGVFMARTGGKTTKRIKNNPIFEAYIDSGANRGITFDKNDAIPDTIEEDLVRISLAGTGKEMFSKASCSICIMDDNGNPVVINDVLIVEEARSKLVSTSNLHDEGFSNYAWWW